MAEEEERPQPSEAAAATAAEATETTQEVTQEADDREAAIPEFLEWLKQHGVEHPKIGFQRQGANNLSLLAVDDIHPGDDVVSVPLDELINVRLLKRLWPQLADFDPTAIGADMHGLIYVFLVTEKKRPGTPYGPLFRMLPRPGAIGTPMSYSEERLGLLKGTNLYETVQKIKGRLRKLAEYYPTLQAEHRELFGGLSCTYEELVWGLEVFWSRAFGVLLDGEQVASLVPLCGMSNHSAEAMVSYVTDVGRGRFCLRSDMEVGAGQQFYNNYRHRSNEKLLLNYGFVCENNPLDAYTVKVSLMPDDPLYTEKARLLAAHDVAWEHYLTLDAECPIPDSLLDCLRILSLDETEAYFWRDDLGFGRPVSDRNEVEMLRVLAKLLARQYDKLVFKDIDGDLEKVRRLADEGTDYALYCIYTYRLGQAMILRNAADVAQAMYARALQAVPWTPQFIIGARREGSLAAYNDFAQRAQVFRGVQYSSNDETGEVCLVATQPLRRGDVVISVPAAALVTDASIDAYFRTPAVRAAARAQDDFAVAAAVMLVLPNFSASEHLLAFYRCVPREFMSPVFLDPDTMERYLAGTPLLPYAAEMREQFQKEYKALCAALAAADDAAKPRARAPKSRRPPVYWGLYAWSRLVAECRLMEGEGGAPVFVPLPFLPRHCPYRKLDKQYDPATGCFVYRATSDVRAGQELFDSVGSDQSFDHFLRGGFLLFQNPEDFQDIALGTPVSDDDDGDLGDSSELTDLRVQALGQLHLLASTQDAIDHYLQCGHFPHRLLDHMRVLAMSPDELEVLLAAGIPDLTAALEAGTFQLRKSTEAMAVKSLLEILEALLSDIHVIRESDFDNGVLPDDPLHRAVAAYVVRQKRIIDSTISALVDAFGDLVLYADDSVLGDDGDADEENGGGECKDRDDNEEEEDEEEDEDSGVIETDGLGDDDEEAPKERSRDGGDEEEEDTNEKKEGDSKDGGDEDGEEEEEGSRTVMLEEDSSCDI